MAASKIAPVIDLHPRKVWPHPDTAAGELWLRGQLATVEDVLLGLARALTVRLAEKLAQALSSMMRLAESIVTPETECLFYTTYWFRPILSELIGTARSTIPC